MSVVRFKFRSFAACRLLPLRPLERSPDQRELESADVGLEVESLVGQPRAVGQRGRDGSPISGPRSATSICGRPWLNVNARSTMFSSCRTLPGHEYAINRRKTS